jgi:hypothetical protein
MTFEILGEISAVETFATGTAIREIGRLRRICGRGRWRKRKGLAQVRFDRWLDPSSGDTLVRGQRNWPQGIQDKAFHLTARHGTIPIEATCCVHRQQ